MSAAGKPQPLDLTPAEVRMILSYRQTSAEIQDALTRMVCNIATDKRARRHNKPELHLIPIRVATGRVKQ